VLETDGSNLKHVLSLPDVDPSRTTTNHIQDVFLVLGVEATRKSILVEIRKVLDAYGIYVNYRHLSILCDAMTHFGELRAVSRFGIAREQNSSL